MVRQRRPTSASHTPSLFAPVDTPTESDVIDPKAPLAARMRPRTLEEFVGQDHIVGANRILRKSIEADQVPSIVLWGPPGSGKTTLARIIANATKAHFSPVSAVTSGVADLRRVVQEAQDRKRMTRRRSILFIDEIHRFNKGQQDAVLPYVEDGTVTLIGATTENPSFEVVSPLLSRARVFQLKAIEPESLKRLLQAALADKERGLGNMNVALTPDAEESLVEVANGDARTALNALELATSAAQPDASGKRTITLPMVEDAVQTRHLRYDRAGDEHFDTISAFIKSVRGSDPDAAVYWLARMLEAGEDLMFVARRIVILASEDIGMADPNALSVAIAAQQAAHFIGMPEAFYPLTQATIYLATAPKSNSAGTAYSKAKEDVEATLNQPVPLHLRNAATGLMKGMGYGKGYRYAHDYASHQVEQEHLPESLKGKRYYEPGVEGYEAEIAKRLQAWGKRKPKP